MMLALVIIHVVIAVVLVVVVLMQHGKQQGLSGAIAGGAETFFGKNKGRTVDAMLKKFTAVIAALFIISSLVLTAVSVREYKAGTNENAVTSEAVDGSEALPVEVETTEGEAAEGETAEGETAEGEAAEGETAEGEAAEGEAAEGEAAEGEAAAE